MYNLGELCRIEQLVIEGKKQMNRKFVKIAVSTTLSVGIAVSGTGYSGSAWAQAAGMGWSTEDRETVLQPIEEDSGSREISVSSILQDKVPSEEVLGIAIMDTDTANGIWEYYNGSIWYNIEKTDGGTSYLLLAGSDKIRFTPNPNWNGQASMKYKLWDMSSGSRYAKNVDTSSAAYSTDQGEAYISVTPVNDAPYLTDEQAGEYLYFDGNGDYVTLPSNINSIYADSFTVEGYLKVNQFNTWMRFFESANGPGSDNIFVGFTQGKMNFSAYNGSSGPVDGATNNMTTVESFPLNQWVHVALVYNQEEKRAYIYWNGELKASGAADLSSIGSRFRANHYLGKSSWGQDGYYSGGMKDVRFWSKAKSKEDVIREMNTTLTGTETDLIASYSLDSSSNGDNAVSLPEVMNGQIENAVFKQAEGFISAVTTDMNRTAERAFKVFDVDGDELQVTAVSSNPNLISNDNLEISGAEENRTITMKPTANQYGTSRITVKVNDGIITEYYDFQLIVNGTGEIIVTDVILSKNDLELTVGGENEQLSASISPANANNPNVIWSSSDPSVATVDENGVITPVGPGSAIITVTTVDGEYTDTVTVNVADKPGNPENVAAIPGDGEAIVNFTAPAFDGGSPITNYTVTAQPGGITASGTESPIKVTGLENGIAYTFTVVATNRAGDSLSSISSASVTPMPPAPGAPILLEPVAGNGEVTLTWNGVDEATGYKVFMSESPEAIDNEVAAVTDSVYSHTITGLTNGKAYYFVLKATNTGSDSAPSLPVTATPMTVPGVPTNITATAGNRQAIITFTPPVDDGGSPITGYEVTAMPGNHKVFGTSSPITMTGLDNGTSYTFTVTAINGKGNSVQSAESESVTPLVPTAPPSEDDTNVPTPPTTPVTAPQAESEILINGKAEDIGTVSTSEQNGQSVIKMSIDEQKLNDKLASEGSSSILSIAAKQESDVLIGELTGQTVKNLEKTETKLEIKTSNAAYILPADAIRVDEISKEFGAAALQDIKFEVKVAATNSEMVKVIENAAVNGKFTLITPAVDFSISATYGNQSVEISEFNQFVTRMIAIPDGVDVSKITTGVIVDANGSVRHVPTKVTQINSKYYAMINSLTSGNSYSVIWNPIEFSDVQGHWAQAAVNNMGSRMVVDGVGSSLFNPDQNITRAEFAAIIVRGLGLARDNQPSSFTDVAMSDWYNSAVITAAEFGLIQGFGDGTFRPNEQITREQAMVIIAKAMEITELNTTLPTDASQLDTFVDAPDASKWASVGIAKSVQAGVINGRSETKLAPKANMTRAEVAAIVERLLQKSELI